MFATPVPVFAPTATQAVATCVPGCSGKVAPGAPASANAGPVLSTSIALSAPVAMEIFVKRLIRAPPSALPAQPRATRVFPESLEVKRTFAECIKRQICHSALAITRLVPTIEPANQS
jgi:hypothetical protein